MRIFFLTTVSICISVTSAVTPEVGAPDFNNVNMEFTPDDASAGGVPTDLDNVWATPMAITEPPTTIVPVTTQKAATTTNKIATITVTTPPPTTAAKTTPPQTTVKSTTAKAPTTTTTRATTATTTTTTTTPLPQTTPFNPFSCDLTSKLCINGICQMQADGRLGCTCYFGYTKDPHHPLICHSATFPNGQHTNNIYNRPNQLYPNQYPNQQYPNQQYPNQQYPNQQYPNQQYPNQQDPNRQYPNQQYPNRQYPKQQYPNQQYPNQGFPQQPQFTQGGFGGTNGFNVPWWMFADEF